MVQCVHCYRITISLSFFSSLNLVLTFSQFFVQYIPVIVGLTADAVVELYISIDEVDIVKVVWVFRATNSYQRSCASSSKMDCEVSQVYIQQFRLRNRTGGVRSAREKLNREE